MESLCEKGNCDYENAGYNFKDVPEFLRHFKNSKNLFCDVGVPHIMESIGKSMRETRPEMKRSPCELNPCKISTPNSKYRKKLQHFENMVNLSLERLFQG